MRRRRSLVPLSRQRAIQRNSLPTNQRTNQPTTSVPELSPVVPDVTLSLQEALPLFALKSCSFEQLMMAKLDAVGSSIKVQILQTAMLHSDVATFDYYVNDEYGRLSVAKSPAYVALVLGSFMRGSGRRVPDAYTFGPDNGYHGRTKEDTAAKQLAFREQLSTQIHQLTGTKPRLAVQADGTYSIYSE